MIVYKCGQLDFSLVIPEVGSLCHMNLEWILNTKC